MSEGKILAGARVTVTLEVSACGSWGPDCTVDQVHRQAVVEAVSRITRLIQGDRSIRIVGEPQPVAVIGREGLMAFSRRTRAALAAAEALPHLGVCLVDAGNGVLALDVAQFTLRMDADDRVVMHPVRPLRWTVDRACVAVGVRLSRSRTYEPLAGGSRALRAGDSVSLDDYPTVIR